ncbi:CPBP family intramembrane metalloprotease [Rheinheimera riviphila]|uniref:CPBP family intramembrane metalloprotease n=1 Tax=Rheinheimera riviphila TaxID=1834037 RepID=A0A437R030_9GAMM|nr:CPBP family glutamic-type intramembrane protease [Rheinheimera riviphila]RVU40118.1 CPBP family intramembrane metalloprotease [Rheinheimera riviphila]
MNKIFFNAQQQLRNGWWVLVFIAILALSRQLYKPTRDWLAGLGASTMQLEPLALVFLLLVSWSCVLLRRQRLADLGLALNSRWWQQLLFGTAAGMSMMAVIALLMWSFSAATFGINPKFQAADLVLGAYLLLLGAALEELLFRGFVFQRLIDGLGVWPTQLLFAAVFAAGHWENPGLEGSAKVVAMLDLALASLLLGLAYLKTRSLALPLGLHFGWNWAQGYLLGFQVSGYEHNGWLLPQLQAKPDWLTGGSFGAEASIFAVFVDCLAIWLLWRWRGVAQTSTAAEFKPDSTKALALPT